LLINRLRTAVILLVIVFGFMYLDVAMPLAGIPGLWIIPIYLVLCLGTAREAISIVRNAWQIPVFWSPAVVLISAALPILPELLGTLGPLNPLEPSWSGVPGRLALVCLGNWLLASFLGFLALMNYKDRQEAIGWLVSVGLLLYISVSTSIWWIIRQVGEPKHALLNIIGIALVTKMADSGAYFTGKNLGRSPLAPVLSPKKTWEGLFGGWIFACLAAVIFFTWAFSHETDRPLWQRITGALLLGTALTWMGLLGDLTESMMKRSGSIKDSGGSLAGLGGVWDVTDSLIPAGVVGLIAILLGWI
jgi:phosphatidate cytidylyltransferase